MDSGSRLTASLEDYLEAIFHLLAQDQVARASEISRTLKVHKSSVTGALKALARLELIHHQPYGLITLTETGRKKAEDIVRRHETLEDFFTRVLGIDPDEAEVAACQMEHAISRRVVNRLILLGEFIECSSPVEQSWPKEFLRYCLDIEAKQEANRLRQADPKGKPKVRRSRKRGVITLKDLVAGDRAVITGLEGEGPGFQRLLDTGATEGAVIEVERVAPRGESLEILVRGYHLSLRDSDAQRIRVVAQ